MKLDESEFGDAITLFKRSFVFGQTSADCYYRYALANKKLQNLEAAKEFFLLSEYGDYEAQIPSVYTKKDTMEHSNRGLNYK